MSQLIQRKDGRNDNNKQEKHHILMLAWPEESGQCLSNVR
jgi:hypothetical protein